VKANTQLIGRATFRAPPGGTTTVLCPNPWIPGNVNEAQKGILVQIYDPLSDQITAPYDAVSDRHVARNDGAMDPIINSITVSGTLSPDGHKTLGTYPQSVTFTDSTANLKFSATISSNNQYSILLPNHVSYLVTVTYIRVAGVRNLGPGTEDAGTLNLDANTSTYNYDITW
jgi:hypothetical protein